MKNAWKKTGWLALTVLPGLVSVALQLLLGAAFIIIGAVIAGVQAGMTGMTDPGQIEQYIMETFEGGVTWGIVAYHLLAIPLFGLWYYFGCGRRKPVSPLKIFKGRCIPVSVLMGIAMCVGANALVLAGEYAAPRLIQQYEEAAEAAGLGTDPFVIFASIILAPIGEEILCRGVVFHYAGKVVRGIKNPAMAFWIANGLQAVMFGVIHGNLVQGTYAVLLGLCLGWLRYRYHSLYPAMLGHMVVNFSSTYLAVYLFAPIPDSCPAFVMVLGFSAAVIIALGIFDRAEYQ